jgi:hypothetical protein
MLYEEAAELGLFSAAENAAVLYDSLSMRQTLCHQQQHQAREREVDIEGNVELCETMLDLLSLHRWMQLAQYGGESLAMRKVAQYLLALSLSPPTASSTDTTSLASRSLALSSKEERNALQWLALSSKMGSSHAMIELGWLLYQSNQTERERDQSNNSSSCLGCNDGLANKQNKNQSEWQSIANDLFQLALQTEWYGREKAFKVSTKSQQHSKQTAGKMMSSLKYRLPPLHSDGYHTDGIAPVLAILRVWMDHCLLSLIGKTADELVHESIEWMKQWI